MPTALTPQILVLRTQPPPQWLSANAHGLGTGSNVALHDPLPASPSTFPRFSNSTMTLFVAGMWSLSYILAAGLHLVVEKPFMNMEVLLWTRMAAPGGRSTGTGSHSGGTQSR